jgi:hypothetical protein
VTEFVASVNLQAEAALTLQVGERSRSVLIGEIPLQQVLVNLIRNGGEIPRKFVASHHAATNAIGANEKDCPDDFVRANGSPGSVDSIFCATG